MGDTARDYCWCADGEGWEQGSREMRHVKRFGDAPSFFDVGVTFC